MFLRVSPLAGKALAGNLALTSLVLALGCTSSPKPAGPSDDAGADVDATAPQGSRIEHVIVVIQENHTFDNYFASYCTAPAGSNPTCTSGPACCETAPPTEPSGSAPVVLDDKANADFDPDHTYLCEIDQINGGKMDRFVTSTRCGDKRNVAVSPASLVKPYHDLAAAGSLGDRYFQPVAGQSAANDMYLAAARFVFRDNELKPDAPGKECSLTEQTARYEGKKTVADLLLEAGKTAAFYAEGWNLAKADDRCPAPPPECVLGAALYPCSFEPSDVPFLYYDQLVKRGDFMRDYVELEKDIQTGRLPNVSWVKAIGFRTEHPGYGITVSDGTKFVTDMIARVMSSPYKDNTLILVTWDEGGGYYDHVSTPPTSKVDNEPYGTRVPLIAVGRFARKNHVSHVEMEHSSIVKFMEWNFLGGVTGQLQARDAVVNNIGSMLDPQETGAEVPER